YFEFFTWPWSNPTEEKEEEDEEDDDINPIIQENPFTQDKLANLKSTLQNRIAGQDRAIEAIVSALDTYAAGLNDPNQPIGSFLFMGPSGTGKTQLALELAQLLLSEEYLFIRLNMSEYRDNNSDIARLIGVPIGYSGWEHGGQFTEQLRKSRYGIILLDDID